LPSLVMVARKIKRGKMREKQGGTGILKEHGLENSEKGGAQPYSVAQGVLPDL